MLRRIVFLFSFVFICHFLKSQNSIKGRVTSSEGEGLYGATIKVHHSMKGTSTDEEGFFQLTNIPNGELVLISSYVGFKEQWDTLEVSTSIDNLIISMEEDVFLADELVVMATRVKFDAPISHTNIDEEEIAEMNIGRDVPYIVNQSPSVVSTSDAGAGIGYSALRIRGIDQSNINVTINGIPLNDAEGHGVFWVDLPDFSSSLSGIQIQRGVGTSTNGAGAFGATINMQTEKMRKEAYAELMLGAGSFNTFRGSAKFGSGLINKYWSFDGRLSRIQSDGYVDRAHSYLTSYYLSGGFNNGKTSVKILGFGGHENTYQSWNGIDRETMKEDRTFNSSGAIYNDQWEVIRYYENQIDNYDQDHLQMLLSHELGKRFRLNLAAHYTYGRGYYESYRQDVNYADYGLMPDTGASNTDLIDRQWLDNDFYGLTYNLNYHYGLTTLDFGGGLNRYEGDHFGEVIWARYPGNSEKGKEYYRNVGLKDDFNVYLKIKQSLGEKLSAFLDVQYRMVDYGSNGTEQYLGLFEFEDQLNFFNPKFGMAYRLNAKSQLYYSLAVANREPNRNDYFNAIDFDAKPEHLNDHELGYRYAFSSNSLQANIYYMDYRDQLVLTGEINDVGELVRSNVGNSYRGGLELSAKVFFTKNLKWMPNLTFSTNRNVDFKYLSEEGDLKSENTPLAYSPDIILNNAIQYQFLRNFKATLYSYYVGEQYLNNTGEEFAKLDAYQIHDFRLEYSKALKSLKNLGLYVNVNNLLNADYVSNGYLWGQTQYVYAQAGRNFILGMNLKF